MGFNHRRDPSKRLSLQQCALTTALPPLNTNYPTKDLNCLISFSTQEDLNNMIDEYDRILSSSTAHQPPPPTSTSSPFPSLSRTLPLPSASSLMTPSPSLVRRHP
ncbi:hypothetical protein AAC387_Pa04g2806 [Persea americana]